MENSMIKKEWQKMSRNLKKLGINHTCVMNAKQMKLGTATIMVDFICDAEAVIKKILSIDIEKEAMENAKNDYSYMKRQRHDAYENIFLPGAIRDLEKEPENESYQRYYKHTKEAMESYDNGTYMEWSVEYHKERIQKYRNEYIENIRKNGTHKEQVERSINRYNELINSEPVKKFMEATGAKVFIESVPERDWYRIYARFTY